MQVRDLLTSTTEQATKGKSKGSNPTLKADAVPVDAVVSTIGFPLVGGPAGTMEGGRQADVAKGILTAKNVPYMVAAPLLIQVSNALLQRHHLAGTTITDDSASCALFATLLSKRCSYNAFRSSSLTNESRL